MSIAEMREQAISRIREEKNPALIEEVFRILDSGKGQQVQKTKTKFSFDWAGGLKELKGDYTAVELQHHINTLRK